MAVSAHRRSRAAGASCQGLGSGLSQLDRRRRLGPGSDSRTNRMAPENSIDGRSGGSQSGIGRSGTTGVTWSWELIAYVLVSMVHHRIGLSSSHR